MSDPLDGAANCRGCPEPPLSGSSYQQGRQYYREHALISSQEHEALEVLLACQGQLRLGPSGHVIGIEMNTAVRLGTARGSNLAVLSELLPAAEAGLVEALQPESLSLTIEDGAALHFKRPPPG